MIFLKIFYFNMKIMLSIKKMKWIIKFYHTESMYKAGIVSFTQTRMGSREAVYNEAKNLAKARGDYTFEIVPA